MRDRLRIRDVQLYIRDLLTEYAKLQRFTPVQSAHARCMDWRRLLLEFEWPHYSEVSRRVMHPGGGAASEVAGSQALAKCRYEGSQLDTLQV